MTISNTFTAGTPWDPYRYVNEALTLLEQNLGMASRVVRGFDKSAEQLGSTLRIKVPQAFTAGSEPIAGGTNLAPTYVDVVADKWRGVRFGATDKELAFGGDQIIDVHIRPAMYELARDMDVYLALLYKDVAWQQAFTSPAAVADITSARKVLVNNKVPVNDGDLFFMVDADIEAELLNLQAFSQFQGAGPQGAETQASGLLGRKYGFEFFINQAVQTSTPGAAVIGTQLQLNAEVAAGAAVLTFKDSGASLTGTVAIGDTFVIAGNTQSYVITNDVTAGANLLANVTFSPPAVQTYAISTNVTLSQVAASAQNLAFHRTAFVLGMAELPAIDPGLGVMSAVVANPKSGLSIRMRRWYDTATNIPMVAFDWLYGVKTLDPNRAVRVTDP